MWTSTALLVLGRAWGSACTAVVLAVLARHLSGAEFGRLTFYLALVVVLDGLVDFGTSSVAVQRSAHDRWALPAVLIAARRVRAGNAALGLLVVAVAACAAGERGAGWLAVAAFYPFTRVLELSAVVYQNEIAWRVPVAVRAAAATTRLGLVLGLRALGVADAVPFLLAHVGGLALANVWLWAAAARRVPRPSVPVVAERGLFLAALPLGLAGLCQQLYFYVDNLFVRALRGEEELGRYNAAVRTMSLLIVVSSYATTAALPWLARRHRDGALGDAAARLSHPMFVAACAGLGLFWPWTDPFLAWLFGAGFEAAGPSLRWLVAATAAIYAGAGLLTAAVAAGRARAVLVVTASALALNVAGNAWLVPRHGMEGAAMATLATELLVTLGAFGVLTLAGARPLGRPARWLLGPAAFGAAALASAALAP